MEMVGTKVAGPAGQGMLVEVRIAVEDLERAAKEVFERLTPVVVELGPSIAEGRGKKDEPPQLGSPVTKALRETRDRIRLVVMALDSVRERLEF